MKSGAKPGQTEKRPAMLLFEPAFDVFGLVFKPVYLVFKVFPLSLLLCVSVFKQQFCFTGFCLSPRTPRLRVRQED
jgi:hypothetical protein